MRKLHLVGFTSDRKGLIFSARRGSKSGGFVVPFDDTLVETLVNEQRRRNGDDVSTESDLMAVEASGLGSDAFVGTDRRNRPVSTLTPREMQTRLRAGRTIAEVAREARVDVEWVQRFAVPILAEQAQMVELARNMVFSKPRRGPSAEPLGVSVAENLVERGVVLMDDAFDAAWTANQLHDVVWAVRLRYRSRGHDQEAVWEVNVATGRLTSRNPLASALGFVDERQRRAPNRPGGSDPEAPEAEPAHPGAPAVASARPRRTRSAPASTRGRPGAKKASPRQGAATRSKKAPGASAVGRKRATGGSSPTAKGVPARPATKARRPVAKAGPVRRARGTKAASQGASAAQKAQPAKTTGAARKTTTAVRKAPKATRTTATASRKASMPTRKRAAPGTAAGSRKAPAPASRATGPRRSKARAGAADRAAAAAAAPTRAARTRGVTGVRQASVADPSPARVGTNGSPGFSNAQSGNGRATGPGRFAQGTAAGSQEPARVPINRLATNRVAATRAAAGRLTGDRRAANPVPPPDDDAVAPTRPRPRVRVAQPRPGRVPESAARPVPASAAAPSSSPVPPTPRQPPAPAAEGDSTAPGAPAPPDMMRIDDLLESVDFDEVTPRPISHVRPLIAGRRAGDVADADAVGPPAPRRSQPLRAWPLGAG